jgi:hypothetical protein
MIRYNEFEGMWKDVILTALSKRSPSEYQKEEALPLELTSFDFPIFQRYFGMEYIYMNGLYA